MKLTYFQLGPKLSKKISPVYMVSGEDILLKQDAIDLIRQAAKNAGFIDKTRLTPESGFDWEQLHSFLFSNSLMADKQLLELDLRDTTPNKAGSAILCEFAKNPSPDHVLLIDLSKVDAKIAKSAWYQALEKIGDTITIWPVPREQLPQWITERAKKLGLTFLHDAAVLLSEYCEGNLVSAAQAIEKLALLHLNKPIDTATVFAAISDESRFSIFDFVENLIAGDKPRTLHVLENLKLDGAEPALLLWAITRELRLLTDMAAQLKSGLTYESLFQKHRIFAKRQTAIRRFLSTSSEDDCLKHLASAAHLDRVIKGAMPGNIWNDLQLFCLRLV